MRREVMARLASHRTCSWPPMGAHCDVSFSTQNAVLGELAAVLMPQAEARRASRNFGRVDLRLNVGCSPAPRSRRGWGRRHGHTPASETRPGVAISLVDVRATRALARCVSRFPFHHRHSGSPGLVRDVDAELMEGPAAQAAAHRVVEPCPSADSLKVFRPIARPVSLTRCTGARPRCLEPGEFRMAVGFGDGARCISIENSLPDAFLLRRACRGASGPRRMATRVRGETPTFGRLRCVMFATPRARTIEGLCVLAADRRA